MTREEAIEKLERRVSIMKYINDIYADNVDGEALEMAIEALKQNKETIEVKRGKWENVNYCPYCGAKMDTNENYDSEE